MLCKLPYRSSRFVVLFVFCALLAGTSLHGCSSDDATNDATGDTKNEVSGDTTGCSGPEEQVVPTASCEGLDEGACAATCGCMPLDAHAAEAADMAYAGCWTAFTAEGAAKTCTSVITCAAEPVSGSILTFSSGCLPDGWASVDCPTQGLDVVD